MQRLLKALPVALIAAAMFPAVASAANINVGATNTKLVAPGCKPNSTLAELNNCHIVLFWSTVIPSVSDGVSYPTTITKPGRITSFTVGVSGITSNASLRKQVLTALDSHYGGPPEARLTVLRAVGNPGSLSWRVMAQSGVWNLSSYLGKVQKMTLQQSLPVVKGDVVALTIPTWAPSLLNWVSGDKVTSQYRLSYSTSCGNAGSNVNVQSTIGEFAKYGCEFTTRPQFTANEVPSS